MSTDDAPATASRPPERAVLDAGRTRRLFTGIASAVVSRGVAAVAPLLLVPITFGYLGTHVYGLWMAVLSLTSMAVWADLGLGNGLMTRLSQAVALRDLDQARRLVASAYALLATFAVIVLALLALVVPWVPWDVLFNVTDARGAELAPPIALVALGAFVVNVPLSLVQRIQYAHQEVTQSNVWVAIGSLTAVALAWVAVQAYAGALVVVLAVAAGPILGNLLNTAWFVHRHREVVPSRRDVGGEAARSLVGLGGRFLVITLMSAVALNVDTIIVAHTSGLDEAAVFAVAVRALTALGLLVTLVNLPLWPANAEAMATGDLAWVERTTRRMAWLSGVGVLLPGLVVGLASAPLFSLWLGSDAVLPSRTLVLVLAAWWTLSAAVSPFMMVLNAAEIVRPQLVGWGAYLILSVPVKVLLGSSMGPEGVVVAGIALYLVTVIPAAHLGYRSYRQHAAAAAVGSQI